MKPLRFSWAAVGAFLFILALAGCATTGPTEQAPDSGAAGEGPPSTTPASVSTPWRGTFPEEPGERLWTPRKEGENVVAHRGVILRAGNGWYFYPAGNEDPRSLILRARSATGAADLAVHLLPEEDGFTEEVMTEEFVRLALRRVLSGEGAANSDLLKVEGGAPGELVFLAREQGSQEASIAVRAVPSFRGLYIIAATGDTPRDYSAASGVAGSFELVSPEVSLRIPQDGPAFFSRWEGAAWLTDSREGSLFSVPRRELLLLSTPYTNLPALPEEGSLTYVSRGVPFEVVVEGPVSAGTNSAVQMILNEEGIRALLVGRTFAGMEQQERREELAKLVSTYIIDRQTALEALR
jgi:hypothetical protein